MNLIDNLKWRYATKVFDPNKQVSEEDLEKLKEAVRLSVSSYGLQLYQVLIIENPEVRQALKKVSWDQSQITDASLLFVFCNFTRNYKRGVDDYIQLISKTQEIDSSKVMPYGETIKTQLDSQSTEQKLVWAEKQTYLALANLLTACAELKIDACPMEGFDSNEYNRILGLTEQGLNAAIIAPVGYRSEKDQTQFRKKVRKSSQALFQTI